MVVKNQVQLITYPDSMGGNLKVLNEILEKYFPDAFQGGIHILPPFPSSGDRGFAPLTYLDIDPQFGSWKDIKKMGEKFDILLDLMVNHISQQSIYFQDFLKKGRKSEYADLFILLDKLWEDRKPNIEDINKMFLRRERPYSTFTIEDTGEKESLWTTFGKTDPSEQIDLDIKSDKVKALFIEFFENFSRNNVKIVRLDAVGYIIKKPGTSCFFVEPEIYDFLEWIKSTASSMDIELLLEVHAHRSIQNKLVSHGFWVYDFILPYIILDTFINKSSLKLCDYLKNRPEKQFTMLDCHDGIPIKPDLDELIDTKEVKKVVDTCLERGANLSRILSEKHKAKDGFDVHQIRASYYSLLNCDDNAYIAARAIQFFTPGIPQVYYMGLLAGENDENAVKATGEGREISRHNYSIEEVEKATEEKVVKRLIHLIKFRNIYPAFNGDFEVLNSCENEIKLRWVKEKSACLLHVNLLTNCGEIEYTDNHGKINSFLI